MTATPSNPLSPSQPKDTAARQHSPLPWKEHAGYIYSPGENGANICAMSEPRARTEVGYTRPELGSEAREEIWANSELIITAVNSHASLKAALLGMVDMYVQLVESGDAGFWDAEKVPQVIAARAALSASNGEVGK